MDMHLPTPTRGKPRGGTWAEVEQIAAHVEQTAAHVWMELAVSDAI